MAPTAADARRSAERRLADALAPAPRFADEARGDERRRVWVNGRFTEVHDTRAAALVPSRPESRELSELRQARPCD